MAHKCHMHDVSVDHGNVMMNPSQTDVNDMNEITLNTDIIKTERNKKAWTQSHLAEACGLSLRTIQRIEKSGKSSHESAQAIAAVFELKTDALLLGQPQPFPVAGRWLSIIGAVFLALLPVTLLLSMASMFMTYQAVSDPTSSDPKALSTGVSTALFYYLYVGRIALYVGTFVLAMSLLLFHYRAPWLYRLIFCCLPFGLLILPFGPIIVFLGIMFLVWNKQAFINQA